MEDLAKYLEEFVEPTIRDFEKNPASVRHAFLACVVVFHAVDYRAHPKKASTLRQKWKGQSKVFAVVDDVAHAFKHVVSGNRKNPSLKAQEVVSTPAAAFDVSHL